MPFFASTSTVHGSPTAAAASAASTSRAAAASGEAPRRSISCPGPRERFLEEAALHLEPLAARLHPRLPHQALRFGGQLPFKAAHGLGS